MDILATAAATESRHTTVRPRRRPALSCLECRRRKVKCDRNEPCVRCQRGGTPCVFTDDRAVTARKPITSTAATARPTDAGYTPVSIDNGSSDVASPRTGKSHVSPPLWEAAWEDSWFSPQMHSKPQTLDNTSGPGTHDNTSSLKTRARHDALNGQSDVRGVFSKGRLHGESHWINSLVNFDGIRATLIATDCNDSSTWSDHAPDKEIPEILHKCKSLARAIRAHDKAPDISASLAYAAETIPAKEIADEYVANYIRCSESIFRVLHIPIFLKEYDDYWSSPRNASSPFLVILLLVLSIGGRIYDDSTTEDMLCLHTAKWISTTRSYIWTSFDKDKMSISRLQGQCLLLLAEQLHSNGANSVWVTAGTLLRNAMSLGMHRDPTKLPTISSPQIEIRRRLWCTVLELNLQASLDSGMMPMVTFDDFDTLPPSNIDDEQSNSSTGSTALHGDRLSWTQSSFQILLWNSLRLRYSIARVLNDSFRIPPYSVVLQMSSEMTNAYRKVVNLLPQHLPSRSSEPTPAFLQNMVDLLVRRFVLALHRPFAVRAKQDAQYFFSRKACIDNAFALLYPIQDADSMRLCMVGHGIGRSALVHVAFTFCSELIAQLEEDMLDRAALTRNKPMREEMLTAIKNLLEIHARRLEVGETNVKLSVVLNMALAQMRAMESRIDPKPAMLEAANQSLKKCLKILQIRQQRLQTHDTNDLGNQRTAFNSGFDEVDTQFTFNSSGFDFADPATWLFPDWAQN